MAIFGGGRLRVFFGWRQRRRHALFDRNCYDAGICAPSCHRVVSLRFISVLCFISVCLVAWITYNCGKTRHCHEFGLGLLPRYAAKNSPTSDHRFQNVRSGIHLHFKFMISCSFPADFETRELKQDRVSWPRRLDQSEMNHQGYL